MQHSFFSSVEPVPGDPILGLSEAFRNDSHPQKVNLAVGVYQDSNGRIPMLGAVKKAAAKWLEEEDTKTYLPIDGLASFNSATQQLIFGADSPLLKEKRVATAQTVGGSGGLKVGIETIKRLLPGSAIYISDPSWENHRALFEASGVRVESYPYYDPATHGLRAADMLSALRELPAQSVVLLHASCHNPTGVDLPLDVWSDVVAVCQERNLLPFIDFAYQGFAEGLEEDARPIRMFADSGLTFLLANSYSKSFSLYRERVGAISVVTGSAREASAMASHLKRIVRTIYSNPPSYGAQLVSIVLNDPTLRAQWERELAEMRDRIHEMRQLFVKELRTRMPQQDFSFVEKQRGMFSYSGLPLAVISMLRERFHIYALDSGRICVAAMNGKNMGYVCDAISSSLKEAGSGA